MIFAGILPERISALPQKSNSNTLVLFRVFRGSYFMRPKKTIHEIHEGAEFDFRVKTKDSQQDERSTRQPRDSKRKWAKASAARFATVIRSL